MLTNLKLNGLSVKLNCSNFKVYSYCRNVRFRVCIISKSAKSKIRKIPLCLTIYFSPEKEARFPYAGVADKEELEKVVTEIATLLTGQGVFLSLSILPLTHSIKSADVKGTSEIESIRADTYYSGFIVDMVDSVWDQLLLSETRKGLKFLQSSEHWVADSE